MGLNADLTAILRDVVQFLECLREANLPLSLESIRDSLLTRSKSTLTMLVVERIGRASPDREAYLNMNAVGSRGLMATLKKTETELQEYVGAEEHYDIKKQQQQQDYYECFQAENSTSYAASATPETPEESETALLDIYASFTATQTKSKCQISGFLHRKEGRKLFVFEQYRACWAGLIGSHLLIYGSDRCNRPCTVLPIRGYMARAAPDAISKEQRRIGCTFEIFRPGDRTFQFIAKTPEDMERWIAKICQLGGEKSERKDVSKSVENAVANGEPVQSSEQENPTCPEERYQDVATLSVDKLPEESPIVPSVIQAEDSAKEPDDVLPKDASHPPAVSSDASASAFASASASASAFRSHPPPLPARIRRLPSLPVQPASYQFPEEEEDDIYHRIEDFKDAVRYGNIGEAARVKASDNPGIGKIEQSETYDDVRASVKSETKSGEKRGKKNVEAPARKSIGSRMELTYDDTAGTVTKDGKVADEQDKFASYDDVENVIPTAKPTNVRALDKADESTKSPQKKSFLDRMRNKKESPRKAEKKSKRKIPTPPLRPPPPSPSPSPSPTVTDQQLPTYDDVSELMNFQQQQQQQQQTNAPEEKQPEYHCPPPPRPVYAMPPPPPPPPPTPPPVTDAVDPQEFYDDATAYRDKLKDDRQIAPAQVTAGATLELGIRDARPPIGYPESVPSSHDRRLNLQQTPKKPNHRDHPIHADSARPGFSESIDGAPRTFEEDEHYKTPRGDPRCVRCSDPPAEELYDDIAILAEFTARQKEGLAKRDTEGTTKSQVSPEKKPWNRFVSGRRSKAVDATIAEGTNGRVPLPNGTEDSPEDLAEQHASMRMNTFQKLISRMENSLGKGSARTVNAVK